MALRIILILVMAVLPVAAQTGRPSFHPEIPKVWDDAAMREVELPLAARIPVQHMPSDYYYSIPVRPNLKTYPIYVPGREPIGYWEWLQKQDPRPAFEIAALRTKQDWINAGELVFEAPKDFTPFDDPFTDVRNRELEREPSCNRLVPTVQNQQESRANCARHL
jgi:hypothetical protein